MADLICRHCGNTGIAWDTGKPCVCPAGKALPLIEQGKTVEAQRIILDSLVAAQQTAQANEPRAIIRHFAAAMERKLAANDDKSSWQNTGWMKYYRALMDELCELLEAIRALEDGSRWGMEESPLRDDVLHEAADCANYLMMIADVCGALPETDWRGR